MKRPILISVYSGWGGGDWGFHKAGLPCRLAVDNDKHARECFRLNFPDTEIQGWDMSKVNGKLIMKYLGIKQLDTDILIMSPPCTEASTSGKYDPFGELNILMIRCFSWLVKQIKPKVFVFENVDNLPNGRMHVLFQMIEEAIKEHLSDYDVKPMILNALQYNTPSDRDRLIIIGVHKSVGKPASFPEPTTTDFDALRIESVLPHVDGIYYGHGFDKYKPTCEFANTITKTRNIQVMVDGEKRFPNTPELLKLTGYPPDWKYTGSEQKVWNRVGNSVMPLLAYAIAKHIKENILCI